MRLIHQLSVSATFVEMRFNDVGLSVGTAFFWRTDGQLYLITNWHNLAGRDSKTGQHLSRTAAEPNNIQVGWNVANDITAKRGEFHPIRDDEGQPLWLIHPALGQHVDVVALPITAPAWAEPYAINELANQPLTVEIGHDVFILGYPYGYGHTGLPIWKRGSIASEPDILDPSSPHWLIDTASRPGMSGSPVFRQVWGMAQLEGGKMQMGQGSSFRAVGIYSGRLAARDPLDAQLGICWPLKFVDEIIAGAQRG